MTRAGSARRVATAAAYGGGGLVGFGAAAAGLLVAEGFLARRTFGLRKESGAGLGPAFLLGGHPRIIGVPIYMRQPIELGARPHSRR